ncbi:hypothetical protein A9Q95_00640 [Rhodobacterales bacterium 59_46_T64]|nr:hypothetical protein A9Q95_00640 [Rhodobacterales bacterium 59_46_T64]
MTGAYEGLIAQDKPLPSGWAALTAVMRGADWFVGQSLSRLLAVPDRGVCIFDTLMERIYR